MSELSTREEEKCQYSTFVFDRKGEQSNPERERGSVREGEKMWRFISCEEPDEKREWPGTSQYSLMKNRYKRTPSNNIDREVRMRESERKCHRKYE